MNTNDYNNGQMIFYLGFLVAELPSQMLGKRLGPGSYYFDTSSYPSVLTFHRHMDTNTNGFMVVDCCAASINEEP